jgi:hypothetical protein
VRAGACSRKLSNATSSQFGFRPPTSTNCAIRREDPQRATLNVCTLRVTAYSLMLVKFAFAIAGFVFLTQYGARNRRIAGVLLTFPILNGIALLNSPDPFRVAGAVYPLVMFNSILFWAAINTVRWLPLRGNASSEHVQLIARIGIWGAVWALFAYQLTDLRDRIHTGMLITIYCALACWVTYSSWRRPPARHESKTAPSTFWLNWAVQISLFAVVFFCLLYVSQNASDQKWAGMASALPLPGLFALAAISVTSDEGQLMPIRDSVLLGPLLVVPFNWSVAEVITSLPVGPTGTLIGILTLVLAWSIALLSVIWLLPILERFLDARRP